VQVVTCDWTVGRALLAQDVVMALIDLGESLGMPCTVLLEGKEEEERSYLGFGQGWILKSSDQGEWEEPLACLRAFMEGVKRAMTVVKRSRNVEERPETGERRSGVESLSLKDLESGVMGYLDYEWGLYWQKPSSAKYRPRFFFRLCPVNVVILPQAQKVVLEIFAPDVAEAGTLFDKWEAGVASILKSLTTDPHGANDSKPNSSPISDFNSDFTPIPNINANSNSNDNVNANSNSNANNAPVPPETSLGSWTPNMTKEQFLAKVEALKEQIRAGEIFQAVLSQKFMRRLTVDPWQLYRRLRQVNPSPYLFFMEGHREILVGSSPELLLSTKGRRVSTCPIAGTRPRGVTPEQDRLYERELLADVKENAEHAMLVDLGRNDIGRVARYGTVVVKHYAEVVRYSHVMHLVSRVEGELRPEFDALDALKALLPAGTLSGAPKVRAMELIQELEPEKRGYYGGSLGVVRWNGDIDFCITIRTLRISGDEISVQAGAGVVYDSQPLKEYEETIHKAQALMKVVNECVDGDR